MLSCARLWMSLLWALLCLGAQAEVRVRLQTNATVEGVQTHKKSSVSAGKSFEWDTREPLLILQEKSLPVVLFPVTSRGEMNVKAIPLADSTPKSVNQAAVDGVMSDVLSQISQIQKLTRQHQFKLAYEQYGALKSHYPGVKFLDFIGSSLALLMGDRQEARLLASRAHQAHPEYVEGKKFLDKLSEEH